MKKLYRDDKNNMIFGVCSGLADLFNVDVTLIRIIFATLMFASKGGYLFLFYILYAIIAPTKTSLELEEMCKREKNQCDCKEDQ